MSTLVKVLIGVGLVMGLTILACFGTCIYIGATAPPPHAMTGAKVPAKYVKQLKDLGILRDDEKLECFFSDAITSIEGGVYILTDKRLVLYSTAWTEHEISIPLAEIIDISPSYSTSWIDNSIVSIETADGGLFTFPVSMDQGGDKMYVKRLKALVDAAAR